MVIEYSDLPDDIARRRNPDGALAIWAGSIAVHVFDLDFLRALQQVDSQADALPYPLRPQESGACRRWPAAASSRTKPNAIKFERFIFDLMPSARNAIVVEVDPATAFAPLKNASGAATDTPESVKAQISACTESGWGRPASKLAGTSRWRSVLGLRWTPRSCAGKCGRG